MKRFLFCLIATWLVSCSQVEAATVYAKGISGTTYYKSGATSCDGVTAADTAGDLEAALSAAGTGGTLNICAGTYTTTMIDATDGLDTTHNNQTINCVGNVLIDITGVNDHAVYLNHTGAKLQGGCRIKGANGSYYNLYTGAAATHTITDASLEGGAGRGFFLQGTDTVTRLKVFDHTGRSDVNAGTVVINYLKYKHNGSYLYYNGGTNHVLNNSDFIGNQDEAIRLSATFSSNVNLRNGIVAGNATANASSSATKRMIYNMSSAGGTITAYNSILQPNGRYGASATAGCDVVDGGGNIGLTDAMTDPVFVSNRYPGVVSITVDDYASIEHFFNVADLVEQYGGRATLALTSQGVTGTDYARLVPYLQRGHEVISHSVTHPDLTSLGAGDLQNEVVNSKAAIEAGLLAAGYAYTVNYFACPYNATNATVRAAIKAAGYLGARGAVTVNGSWLLSSINVYNIGSLDTFASLGTTAQRTTTSAFVTWLREAGGIAALYTHTPDASNYTLDQLRTMLGVLQAYGVHVVTFGASVVAAKTGATTADDITYTKTLTDTSNYQLTRTSPALNAGASIAGLHNVAGCTDLAGNPCVRGSAPDMGVYEAAGRAILPNTATVPNTPTRLH